MLRLPAGYRAETDTEVKRSRFRCTLARVDSEEEARAVIAEVRRAYPDARHHCTAFIVEVPDAAPVERSNDDGEPSGTAGRPMLEVLRGSGVTHVVAVVTRWFGGVLLGTGGLARAYSDAVRQALDAAPRVEVVRREVFEVTLDHADAGRVMEGLRQRGCEVLTASYGESVEITVAVSEVLTLGVLVAELTRGRAALRQGDARGTGQRLRTTENVRTGGAVAPPVRSLPD